MPCLHSSPILQSELTLQHASILPRSPHAPPAPEHLAPGDVGARKGPSFAAGPSGQAIVSVNWELGTASMQNVPAEPVVALITVVAGRNPAAMPFMRPL